MHNKHTRMALRSAAMSISPTERAAEDIAAAVGDGGIQHGDVNAAGVLRCDYRTGGRETTTNLDFDLLPLTATEWKPIMPRSEHREREDVSTNICPCPSSLPSIFIAMPQPPPQYKRLFL